MRPSGSEPPRDPGRETDLDAVMRDGDRTPMPDGMPTFRIPVIVALCLVAIWGGIALFWPVHRPPPLRACGDVGDATSCVMHP